MSGEKKQTIWTRNFICMMIANFLMLMSNFSTNTLVSTYASFLGAAPMLMGLLTGMFYGIALAMSPVAGPVQTRMNHRKLLIAVFAIGVVVNVRVAGKAFELGDKFVNSVVTIGVNASNHQVVRVDIALF